MDKKNIEIFGRGSEDNHQGIVSSALMARAFIETGTQPAINIGLVFMADEETGNEYGLTYLVKNQADLFKFLNRKKAFITQLRCFMFTHIF